MNGSSNTVTDDRENIPSTRLRRVLVIDVASRPTVLLGATVLLLLLQLVGSGCGGGPTGSDTSATTAGQTTLASAAPAPTEGPALDPGPSDSDLSPGLPAVGEPSPVRVGAEVLVDEGFASLAGLRVGLIANEGSMVDGVPVFDVVAAAADVELVAAFGPEHGPRGDLPAGAGVDDGIDAATGIPVYSLYGQRQAPTPEMLAELDALVFDLQDVGGRFYTYLSTMGLAMAAAADAGIRFVVLDRPNPAGGLAVAGFGRDVDQESFVSLYPIPAVHGLTAGELALAIRGEGWLPGLADLQLEIVELDGWRRDHRWQDLDRPWVAPSPSLPSAAAAHAYLGTVLFEATSLSVGRGTAEPFTTIGAPFLDAEAVVAALAGLDLPGVTFDAVTFVPEPSAAVPDPPHAGAVNAGVRITFDPSRTGTGAGAGPGGEGDDGSAIDPVAVAVHLLVAIRDHGLGLDDPPLIDRPDGFDLLAGTDRLRLGLADGRSADELIAAWAADVEAFRALRQPYLLYG